MKAIFTKLHPYELKGMADDKRPLSTEYFKLQTNLLLPSTFSHIISPGQVK